MSETHGERPHRNRLATEKSAYLRSAGHQPVDWYPWGEEAFRRAKDLERPVLLDIGAVWCHWCHVMDGESYENPEIADIINQKFVAVKVDRDERPDVDTRYQGPVAAISGQGGWPLTAFLTPEGKVFYGGTYFPPQDTMGRPGFKRVLGAVTDQYRAKTEEVAATAQDLFTRMERFEAFTATEGELSDRLIGEILAFAREQFDPANGGFGEAPKFPHSSVIELLLARAHLTDGVGFLQMATRTLDGMARGGMYDQIGGGFHRYSVDAHWRVPHFEKMSYDNAPHLETYLHAYQITGDAFYRQVAEGILSYVSAVASDTGRGGFYASQDADVGLNDDGDYFTWTLDELSDALPDSQAFEAVAYFYNVAERGDMHHNPRKNVLCVAKEMGEVAAMLGVGVEEAEAILGGARARMLEARSRREAPFVDEALYTNWNGMMIAAFCEAARVLGDVGAAQLAHKSADRLLAEGYDPLRGFAHSLAEGVPSIWGLLDDQVQMVRALLALWELGGEPRYLRAARSLADLLVDRFWDPADGGFFDRASGQKAIPGVATRRKPIQDSPTPGPNAIAALALDRLAMVTGEGRYREHAEACLRAFAGSAPQLGVFAATYGLALHYHIHPPPQVVIVGSRGAAETLALVEATFSAYRPGALVVQHDLAEADLSTLPETVRPMIAFSQKLGGPQAYVCAGLSCAPPTNDPEQLREFVKTFGRSNAL